MEKEEDIIAKLTAYNFNKPVEVTVSFDDSDEEDNRSEFVKKEVVDSDPEKASSVKSEATYKDESSYGTDGKREVTEKIISSENCLNSSIQSVKDEKDILSQLEMFTCNGRVEYETPSNNIAKKRKLEVSAKVQSLQKENKQKEKTSKEIQQKDQNCDITTTHLNNTLVHQNYQGNGTNTIHNNEKNFIQNKCSTDNKANTYRNTDGYIMHLLKSVSEHLILIIQAYHCHLRTANNKMVAKKIITDSMNHFLRVKEHLFNLSYCTVVTIIIPQEENLQFMRMFIKETIELSNNNTYKCTYSQIISTLLEMLHWTKLKQKSLVNLPKRFESANSQPHTNNSVLKENLAQPMQPLDSGINHNINNNNSSLSTFSSKTTNATINNPHDESYAPIIKQVLDQQPKPMHSNTEHKNNISRPNINTFSTNTSETSINNYIPNENVTQGQNTYAPSVNSNYITNENITPEQNKSCIFSSGPPGRQISINVNPIHLKQNNSQVSSNLKAQISTANELRDWNTNPYRAQAPWLYKNTPPTTYDHRLTSVIMSGFHGPPASQQTVSPLLASQPLVAAQPLLTAQPLVAAQPLPAVQPLLTAQPLPAAQPLPMTHPLSAVQPLPLHFEATQPLRSTPPPPYQMPGQAPLPMSRHYMDNQPMQTLQKEPTYEQNQTETNRSVSTDSGFTSPLHFNIPSGPMSDPWAQDQRNMQNTPFITHVTSLNPTASYIEDAPCSICRKTTRKKCIGCLKIYYCSYECQYADWRLHKLICKTN